MKNIQEYWGKIKQVTEIGVGEWGLIGIIVLVGLASFGLGRFSALEDVRPVVDVRQGPGAAKPEERYMGGLYVASRTGSVYYYPWCANIAPEKQVWFPSREAAEKAGYTPSKSCKGLE